MARVAAIAHIKNINMDQRGKSAFTVGRQTQVLDVLIVRTRIMKSSQEPIIFSLKEFKGALAELRNDLLRLSSKLNSKNSIAWMNNLFLDSANMREVSNFVLKKKDLVNPVNFISAIGLEILGISLIRDSDLNSLVEKLNRVEQLSLNLRKELDYKGNNKVFAFQWACVLNDLTAESPSFSFSSEEALTDFFKIPATESAEKFKSLLQKFLAQQGRAKARLKYIERVELNFTKASRKVHGPNANRIKMILSLNAVVQRWYKKPHHNIVAALVSAILNESTDREDVRKILQSRINLKRRKIRNKK